MRTTATTPTRDHESKRLNPKVSKCGYLEHLVGPRGGGEAPPVGARRAEVDRGLDENRHDRRGDDRDEDRALDLADPQGDDEDEADGEDEHRPAGKRAVAPELDGDGRVCGVRDPLDEPRVDEADEGDEQPDADADGRLELGGHGMEDGLPEAGQHEDEDEQTLEDDEAHGVGPGHLAGDGHRDEGVETEAGRQREGVVGGDAHEDRHDARHQGGAGRDGRQVGAIPRAAPEIGAGPILDEAEDERVEDDDVGHREERDEAATDLTAHRRATLGDLEVSVQGAAGRGRGRRGRLSRHGSRLAMAVVPTCFGVHPSATRVAR